MGDKHPLSSPDKDPARQKKVRLSPDNKSAPATMAGVSSSARPTGPKADEYPSLLPDNTFPYSLDEWNDLTINQRKNARKDAWVARSKSWKGFEGVWKGIKVLGTGAYGICGLFERIDGDATRPKNIVVKQVGNNEKDDLRQESRLLRQVGKAGSIHFVKLLKEYYEEGGTGTRKEWDNSPYIKAEDDMETYEKELEVARIYLDYCEGGDLNRYRKDNFG
jgi:hypothetical protein